MDTAGKHQRRAARRSRAQSWKEQALDPEHPTVPGVMPTLNLPVGGGKLAPYAMRPPRNLPACPATLQPHCLWRLRMSSPIRPPMSIRDVDCRHRLGDAPIAFRRPLSHHRPRSRRGDGYHQRGIGGSIGPSSARVDRKEHSDAAREFLWSCCSPPAPAPITLSPMPRLAP